MPAPYPADTAAKGWRFELSYEQIDQSDTWALAKPHVRPWLLMLWMVAWKQVPCGSLPDDDELIAVRIGMPLDEFQEHRRVLLRGWWKADDGRLYHKTIVDRVQAMLEKRASDAKRAADARARKAARLAGDSGDVTGASRVTPDGLTGEFDTKHQAPSTSKESKGASEQITLEGSLAGAVCARIRREAKFTSTNPSDPRLKALLDAGVTPDSLVEIAKEAVEKRRGWAWILATAKGRHEDAVQIASTTPKAQAAPWWDSPKGIIAKGEELGCGSWSEAIWEKTHEQYPTYRNRVMAAARKAGHQVPEGAPA